MAATTPVSSLTPHVSQPSNADNLNSPSFVPGFTSRKGREVKTSINWGTRIQELAIGVGKVALLALAYVSVFGIFLIESDSSLRDYEENFSKFYNGYELTYEALNNEEKEEILSVHQERLALFPISQNGDLATSIFSGGNPQTH